MSYGTSLEKETFLYIGVNPRSHGDDIIATFTGTGLIPLSWYFLFSPEDVKIRRTALPEQLSNFDAEGNKEEFEQYANEPVVFKSTLPDAKARLARYKEVFSKIPYLWSYFKVIEILDKEIEDFIFQLETEPEQVVLQRQRSHPETQLSQVDVEGGVEETSLPEFDPDNPFAGLEDFGAEIEAAAGPMEESSAAEELESLADDDLMAALQDAAALDFGPLNDQPEPESDTEELTSGLSQPSPIDVEDDGVMPIMVFFDQISAEGRGERLGQIPLLLERLLHHAEREGEMTRVMQDLMQEIFRDAQTGYRVTGQLSEDFIQGKPSRLDNIMLGEPSPYVIIEKKLDLEYWTAGTLQSGDERLMFSLTMLPSEQIHIAIQSGRLADVANQVGELLSNSQSIEFKRLSVPLLKIAPSESNIWGFRVLIQDELGEFKPATLLISDPNVSWFEEFENDINLPGVLEDWNIDLTVRFNEFSDIDTYQLVFEGAKDIEETFGGFVRWARRHHIMYRQRFGVAGTINRLKSLLSETNDKILGQLIFDILTNLTELGFDAAIDALSDDAIVRKLPWLYS